MPKCICPIVFVQLCMPNGVCPIISARMLCVFAGESIVPGQRPSAWLKMAIQGPDMRSFQQTVQCLADADALESESVDMGAISLKSLEGKLAPKLVYFMLKKKILLR